MKKWKVLKRGLAVIIISFLGCCIGFNTLLKGEVIAQSSCNNIILLEQYFNVAWGYQNSGRYLDQYGYVYEYSFNEERNYPLMRYKFNSDEDYLKAILNESYYSGRPIGKIDEKELKNILKELSHVNPTAAKTEKLTAYDAGRHTLYTLGDDGKLLELHSSGDYEVELQDNAAKKITRLWDKLELAPCDKVDSISHLESAKVKNGLSNQVGGVVKITEAKNLQFKDGELTFRVVGLDNEEIFIEDVSVETTGNMKAEVEKKAENGLSTIKVKLTGTSKDIESITFHNFKITSYKLIPEIEYSLLIQGDALISYGRDNMGIPDFINLRKEADDYPTCEYRDIAVDSANWEGCEAFNSKRRETIPLKSKEKEYWICGDEGECLIALDLIEQAYGLTGDKVKKEGNHVQLILGKRTVDFTVGSDEVVIGQVAHAKMNAKVVKGDSEIMIPAKAIAILVSAELVQLNNNRWYSFYND